MNNNQLSVKSLVQMQIKDSHVASEEEIKKLVNFFCQLNPLTDDEKNELIKDLHYCLPIKMDRGNCLVEKDHLPWYNAAKKDIEAKYWERYRNYLIADQGFNNSIVDTLDETTNIIMDMLGNPKSNLNFSRKGLVIGDVQSGKTSTYTALINKAADAGYKIIFLLTGTIEKLREQTQRRLDAGFIGLDSTAFNRDKNQIFFGVGQYDRSITGFSITSTVSDFNTKFANQFNGRLIGIPSPILFVLKKNKSVLEKLEQWIRLYNADVNGTISTPMLLIDDEADNASVNTKKDDESPTAINTCIRKLLKLFTKSNYVAFTATPYANIFINPDSNDEMLEDDLFPRHFIYALEAPSNYIGARDIFSVEGKYHYMLKCNNDCEDYVPEKHKKEFIPELLPISLKEAIASFFIANTIRDLRGDEKKHRTMLINISRFINVQERICQDVQSYAKALQRTLKHYSLADDALEHPEIKFIKYVYEEHYSNLKDYNNDEEKNYEWTEILKHLSRSAASIVVKTVNGGNAKNVLNYDDYKEDGLRLIAIGGFSLSRGLTLEGLMISYFYRNSKMYDTLMQMGRWFGYRDHYADLCQVWMSEQSAEWYEYISEATDELRQQVKRMINWNLTPEDFGLGVRSDLNTLLVTAINKMRYTKDVPLTISLNGTVIETPFLPLSNELNNENYISVINWLNNMHKLGFEIADNKELNLALNHPQLLNIPKNHIIDLLNMYHSHVYNLNFVTNDIVKAISNEEGTLLDNWDVVIATGSFEENYNIGELIPNGIHPVMRSFAIRNDKSAIQMSGSKSRLGSVNFAKGGLTKSIAKRIEQTAKDNRTNNKSKSLSQDEYFNTGIKRNPLLIIYPVRLNYNNSNDSQKENEEKKKYVDGYSNLWMGLAIGIPSVNNEASVKYNYTINMVKWKEMLGIDEDYQEETGIEGEDF